jgi:hypothetical protein
MPTNMPTALDTFTAHSAGQTITSAHINNNQDALLAVEKLVVGPAAVNVRGYGATGDGTTDDTTAFTNAIAAIPSAGGALIIPPGTYKATISLSSRANIRILGNAGASILQPAAGATAISVTTCDRLMIDGLRINQGAVGLNINGARDAQFQNLWIENTTGDAIQINGEGSMEFHMSHITVRDCAGIGINYTRTTTIDTGGLYLFDINVLRSTTGSKGIVCTSSAGSNSFVYWNMTSVICDGYVDHAAEFVNVQHIRGDHCWFACNVASKGGLYLNNAQAFALDKTEFINQAVSGYGLEIAGTTSNIFIDNSFFGGNATTTTGIFITAAGTYNNIVLGNYLNNLASLTNDTVNLYKRNPAITSGPLKFETRGNGGSFEAVIVEDIDNVGSAVKHIRNGNGNLQIINGAFGATILELTDAGALKWAGGASIVKHLTGTAAWTPGAIAANAGVTTTVTVTGATLANSVVQVGYSVALTAGLILTGWVSAADTVTVQIRNVTAGAITPTAGTVRASVTLY